MAEQRNRRGVRDLVREGDELVAAQEAARAQYPHMPPEEALFADQFKSQMQAREANRATDRRAAEGRQRADNATRTGRRPFHSEGRTAAGFSELMQRGGEMMQQLGAVGERAVTPQTVQLPPAEEDNRRPGMIQLPDQNRPAPPPANPAQQNRQAREELARRQEAQRQQQQRVPGLPRAAMPPMVQGMQDDRTVADQRAGLRPTRVTVFNADEFVQPGSVMNRGAGEDMVRGILPGEEQQTSAETLATLPPDVQMAVRDRYEASGVADTIEFDDWLSETFAEYPPDERTAMMEGTRQREDVMQDIAGQRPRVNVGAVPLEPGELSPTARARVAAGLPLPEGREPSQYTPEQQRTMSRNVFAPDTQMQRHGGTFGYNPDGSVSMRAPDPDKLDLAAQIAADPEQGAGSDSHTLALADAHGIDVTAYGNDMDLLRAHLAQLQEVHDRLAPNFNAVPSPMGGYRYRPNEENKARAAQRADLMAHRRRMLRYDGVPGFNEQARDPETALLLERRRAARDRAANYGLTQDLRNPQRARGMMIRGLMDAINNNEMGAAAAQAMIGGERDFAARLLNQRAVDVNARAALEQAELAADAAREEQERNTPSAVLARTLARITELAATDPTAAFEEARRHVTDDAMARNQEITEEDRNRQAQILVAQAELRNDSSPANVDRVFERFRNDYQAFVELGNRLRIDPDLVQQRWAALNGTPAEQAGRAVGNAWGDFTQGFRDFIRGARGE